MPPVRSDPPAVRDLLDNTRQRTAAIKFIAISGMVLSAGYAAVYIGIGFTSLGICDGVFAIFYALVLAGVRADRNRVSGITLMALGLIQLGGTALLFVPPTAGTHYFLLLIPIFSLIVIHPDDRFWWRSFTVMALGLTVWMELYRKDWYPAYSGPLEGLYAPVWGAAALLLTVLLTVGIFRAFHRDLHLARKHLHASYQRSESLLKNMLPDSIAERLKDEPRTIADSFEDASVLFADLVGFTEFSSKHSAHETVVMLNEIFSVFDRAVAARGLEKIKTIGDAYMVAAGVPTPRPDHTQQLLELSTEMLGLLAQHNESHGLTLQLRIGVSRGPVIAGVIGSQKFSYDIWGDTVNMASRMESTGIPGRVQVTEPVAETASDSFEFEARGPVQVKGKGEMQTFLLV
jgi:class 3 adenylate cyclase